MPQTTITTSKRFNLNLSDWSRGLLMAVLVPVIAIIADSINQGVLTFNWRLITMTAIGGGLGYILKNLGSPAKIVINNPTPQQVEDVKSGDATAKVVQK